MLKYFSIYETQCISTRFFQSFTSSVEGWQARMEGTSVLYERQNNFFLSVLRVWVPQKQKSVTENNCMPEQMVSMGVFSWKTATQCYLPAYENFILTI